MKRTTRHHSTLVFGSVTLMILLTGLAHSQEREESQVEILKGAGQPIEDVDVDAQQVAELIVRQTNEFREAQGRGPVKTNSKLAATAQTFADYMARTDRYGHRADGNRPADRASEHDYQYCIVAENIAYRYNSAGTETEALADKFVQGWKDSPGHRENMLDRDVRETGVAVAVSKETSHWYAVQMFGRPKSDAIEFQIANHADKEVGYSMGEKSFQLPPRYTRTHMSCRLAPVKFDFPGKSGEADAQVQPKTGDHFSIEEDENELRVKKEKE
ncbi:CAP domain-containing protein [Bremerella alba]|uniref:SCP domain-containing protein n=1 Tax=Bremerella alba TaxID=980252 RepID=A0A7V9A7D8_9BACT|nr:CAP domain-containing protein [Bremerella alba]MBA2114891.1 hypothetical protein [Bremerella alba]